MKAVVATPFDGALDGAIYPKHFVAGDVVEGDLARVAIEQRWATEQVVVVEPKPPADIPADWETFNAAETVALARTLGADDAVKTKAAAVEFIAAEVAKRASEAQA